MTRVPGSYYPRQLEPKICDAIGAQRMLEFDYGGCHRVVQPYCRLKPAPRSNGFA